MSETGWKRGPSGNKGGTLADTLGPLLPGAIFAIVLTPNGDGSRLDIAAMVAGVPGEEAKGAERTCMYLEYLRDEYIPYALKSLRS